MLGKASDPLNKVLGGPPNSIWTPALLSRISCSRKPFLFFYIYNFLILYKLVRLKRNEAFKVQCVGFSGNQQTNWTPLISRGRPSPACLGCPFWAPVGTWWTWWQGRDQKLTVTNTDSSALFTLSAQKVLNKDPSLQHVFTLNGCRHTAPLGGFTQILQSNEVWRVTCQSWV